MPEVRRAPAQVIFENVPKISIITALTYLIIIYANAVTGGALSAYVSTATTVMLFGAVFAIPGIIYDITFTDTFEPAESLWVGFVNFFALLTEFVFTNWDVFKQAALYTIYVYTGLFIFAVIVYVISYYRVVSQE